MDCKFCPLNIETGFRHSFLLADITNYSMVKLCLLGQVYLLSGHIFYCCCFGYRALRPHKNVQNSEAIGLFISQHFNGRFLNLARAV